MKLIDYNLQAFINEVDSKNPAPGGGSVAALCASLGVSLARMVGHLSFEKKKFLALDPTIQFEFKDTHDELLMIKDQLILAIDQDTKAFNQIMNAFSLPKTNDDEIAYRNNQIQEATREAIMIPIKVASLSMSALNHLDIILKYGNKQTVSDLGVAILALATGVEGACLNVLINLSSLKDQIAVNQFKNQVNDLLNKSQQRRQELLELIYQALE
jgi:formiminotetrahydrofolate cyclodeaminase